MKKLILLNTILAFVCLLFIFCSDNSGSRKIRLADNADFSAPLEDRNETSSLAARIRVNRKGKRVIGILDFDNDTGDKGYDPYEKGIPLILSKKLANDRNLDVVSADGIADIFASLRIELKKTPSKSDLENLYNNGGIHILISGKIRKKRKLYLVTDVYDAKTAEISFTSIDTGDDHKDFFIMVDSLTNSIQKFLRIEVTPDEDPGETFTTDLAAMEHFTSGQKFEEDYQPEKAKELYLLAVEKDSTFAKAYYQLSNINWKNLREEDFNETRFYVKKALQYAEKLYPRENQLLRAYRFFYDKKIEEAVKLLRTSVKDYPDNKDAYFGLGQILFMKEDYNGSIEYLNKAIELNWKFVFAHILLGKNYKELGNLPKARESFINYQKLRPDDVFPHIYVGDLFKDNGQFAEAANAYNEAIKIDENSYFPYIKLAEISLKVSNYFKACEYYQKATKLLPDNLADYDKMEIYYRAATVSIYAGLFNEAIISMDKFINLLKENEIDQDAAEFSIFKGIMQYELGNAEEAKESFRESIKLSPSNPHILSTSGIMSLQMNDMNFANECMDKIKQISPDRYNKQKFYFTMLKVDIKIHNNQKEEAADILSKVKYSSDNIIHSYIYAGLLFDAGNINEAEKIINSVSRNQEFGIKDAMVRSRIQLLLAEIYTMKGMNQKAKTILRDLEEKYYKSDKGLRFIKKIKEQMEKI